MMPGDVAHPYAVRVIDRVRRRLADNPLLVDVVIALGLTLASVITLAGGAQDAGSREPLSVALLFVQTLPLIVRRRWPLAVLAVTAGATILHASMASPEGVNESLGAMVAIYSVAERRDRRTSVAATLVTGAAFAVLIATKGPFPANLGGLSQTLMIVGLFWAVGDWSRTRRLYAEADAERIRLLEAEREDRARRAVQDERERIARELHDVVTHHVSVIVIQAGAALTALDRRPDAARSALTAIDQTGRAALADMRRMLGILGEGPADDAGAREPMPGLDRLGELIEQVRGAGMSVELAITGERRPLDAGIELSIYRVVQEALTNVWKHSGAKTVSVIVDRDADALRVIVEDDGRGFDGDGALHGEALRGRFGLLGMRERLALVGGSLQIESQPGSGTPIYVRVPLANPP